MNEVSQFPQQINKYVDGSRRRVLTLPLLLSQGKNAGELQEQTSLILTRYCKKKKQLAYTLQFRRLQQKKKKIQHFTIYLFL